MKDHSIDKLKGMLVGLAVGDALGMVVEFEQRGSFAEVTDMVAGGPFDLPAGYWTDDTSMALCLADSILESGGYDSYDVMDRYVQWRDDGYRSSLGTCFDIGNQVNAALSAYKSDPEVSVSAERGRSAGNGSIMRLAPVVIASLAARNNRATTMHLSAISARETHYSLEAEATTAIFAALLAAAAAETDKAAVIRLNGIEDDAYFPVVSMIQNAGNKTADELKPTGYIIDTIEVATWAFMTTDNFKDGALKAVNMGGDSDTIAAVYGQLAGAYYGLTGIPVDWVNTLFLHDEIIELADDLAALKSFGVVRTRFQEDA